jgi:hypothetical protein
MHWLAWLAIQSEAELDRYRRRSEDSDPAVRTRAVDDLARHRNLQAARLMLPRLSDPHPRVRRHAVLALASMGSDPVTDLLVDFVRTRVHGRAEAIRALGGPGRERAVDALIEALADDDARAAAAESLGRIGHRRAVPALEEMGVKCAADRIARLDALAMLEPAKARAAAARHLDDPDPAVRIRALELVDAVPAASARDPDWRVRLAAIERLKDIPALIDAWDRESGRLKEDCRSRLFALTGRTFPDAPSWRRWWRENGEEFEPGRAKPEPGRTEVRFCDVPIHSRNVAFVIDVSGSMRDGGKLETARREVERTIARLPPDALFTIVPMSSDKDGRGRQPWAARPQPATEMNRALALRFLQREEARGYTNLYDAVRTALESGADTVCVYSDGGASRGTFTSADDILWEIARENRFRKVRIQAPDSKEWQERLMRGLAEGSGGTHALR